MNSFPLLTAKKLIGRHFLDSDENKEYVITDIWFDDSANMMIGTRHPLIPTFETHEPVNAHVLAPADEVDEHAYELDYFLCKLRATAHIGFTPQVSYSDVRSRVYSDAVAIDLDILIQQQRISEDEIAFIDDEHGASFYYR